MSKKKLRNAMKDLRNAMVSLGVPSHLDYKDMNSYQLILNKDTLLDNVDNYIMDLDLYCDNYIYVSDLTKDLRHAVSVVKGAC